MNASDDNSLHQLVRKDEQIEALCLEYQDVQRALRQSEEALQSKSDDATKLTRDLDAAKGEIARLRDEINSMRSGMMKAADRGIYSDNNTLRSAVDAQVRSNKELTNTLASLRRRLSRSEEDLKRARAEADAQRVVNDDLQHIIQRNASSLLHRDHELQRMKDLMAEREDECRQLRRDRLQARRNVVDEMQFCKEKELIAAQLVADNSRLLDHIAALEARLRTYEKEIGPEGIVITDVRHTAPPPTQVTAPENGTLRQLRQQNKLLQDQFADSLVLLQRQIHNTVHRN
eukprot:PhM_4_TR1108/c0_g2_i1/m.55039